MSEVTATAIVTVSVEVYLTQPWSGTATINEIDDRARREAIQALERRLSLQADGDRFNIRSSQVATVIVSESR